MKSASANDLMVGLLLNYNGVSAELDNPLDDMAIGLFVAENVPRGNLMITTIL